MASPQSTTMSFASLEKSQSPSDENYQNYLAWQAAIAERRRSTHTQFNLFQSRSFERMCNQVQYKEEAERDSNVLKDMIENRLSNACTCDHCEAGIGAGAGAGAGEARKERRSGSQGSVSTTASDSDKSNNYNLILTSSDGSSRSTKVKGASPLLGTTAADSGVVGANSRNGLRVVKTHSPPPRSRHHQRGCESRTSATT